MDKFAPSEGWMECYEDHDDESESIPLANAMDPSVHGLIVENEDMLSDHNISHSAVKSSSQHRTSTNHPKLSPGIDNGNTIGTKPLSSLTNTDTTANEHSNPFIASSTSSLWSVYKPHIAKSINSNNEPQNVHSSSTSSKQKYRAHKENSQDQETIADSLQDNVFDGDNQENDESSYDGSEINTDEEKTNNLSKNSKNKSSSITKQGKKDFSLATNNSSTSLRAGSTRKPGRKTNSADNPIRMSRFASKEQSISPNKSYNNNPFKSMDKKIKMPIGDKVDFYELRLLADPKKIKEPKDVRSQSSESSADDCESNDDCVEDMVYVDDEHDPRGKTSTRTKAPQNKIDRSETPKFANSSTDSYRARLSAAKSQTRTRRSPLKDINPFHSNQFETLNHPTNDPTVLRKSSTKQSSRLTDDKGPQHSSSKRDNSLKDQQSYFQKTPLRFQTPKDSKVNVNANSAQNPRNSTENVQGHNRKQHTTNNSPRNTSQSTYSSTDEVQNATTSPHGHKRKSTHGKSPKSKPFKESNRAREHGIHSRLKEEDDREKQEFLYYFYVMEQKGYKLHRNWSKDDDLEEMRFEYHTLKGESELKDKVKQTWNFLTSVSAIMQLANKKLDPFKISLDGWTDDLDRDKDRYEPILRKIHKTMHVRFNVKPGVQLVFMLLCQLVLFLLPRLLKKVHKPLAPNYDDLNNNKPYPFAAPIIPDVSDKSSNINEQVEINALAKQVNDQARIIDELRNIINNNASQKFNNATQETFKVNTNKPQTNTNEHNKAQPVFDELDLSGLGLKGDDKEIRTEITQTDGGIADLAPLVNVMLRAQEKDVVNPSIPFPSSFKTPPPIPPTMMDSQASINTLGKSKGTGRRPTILI